ncbi:hypothetical protein [Streptomyces sp. NRRL B-1347]|uniref:zinc finger domain-containing protein n=1 Tax=Streptomyces sp. NRRL B-1347 TaxID=1476877 RepID=UPI00055F3BDD|nr:hypothetical protein [Streptomyces sp. NRRL B-1347]
MQADKRQIQTAVLGSADSEEPLVLPLEAIELGAFRQRHEGDTFWCGILLGGCGLQLTTKLYTDRVCHFAHHPGPDGHLHVCGRRARGISSADHLYVKAAAAAWLHRRCEQAGFEFARPEGAPIGSVVDIQLPRRGRRLRVHLDQVVPPVWDGPSEPVLGLSVPVDRSTLIQRWYVHRIRLDSQGTARHVRIGTEAFARPTEWFTLDECEMTERGLSTPAVERIIRSRSTPPPTRRALGNGRKAPDSRAQAQALLRRLGEARTVGAVVVVNRVSSTLTAMDGVDQGTRTQIDAALEDAKVWLEEQAELRRQMFSRLGDAVSEGNAQEAGGLLVRVNAIAAHDRTDAENQTAGAAAEFLAALVREQEEAARKLNAEAEAEAEARRRKVRKKMDAAQQVRVSLRALRRQRRSMPQADKRRLVAELAEVASVAGDQLTPSETSQINTWKARVERERAPAPERVLPVQRQPDQVRPPKARKDGRSQPGKKDEPQLHHQVARKDWYRGKCPRCHAGPGKACANDDRVGPGKTRQVPHDERLLRILRTRKTKPQPPAPRRERRGEQYGGSPARTWHAMDVTCPKCNASPKARCTPHGTHHERVEWAREFTRKLWG